MKRQYCNWTKISQNVQDVNSNNYFLPSSKNSLFSIVSNEHNTTRIERQLSAQSADRRQETSPLRSIPKVSPLSGVRAFGKNVMRCPFHNQNASSTARKDLRLVFDRAEFCSWYIRSCSVFNSVAKLLRQTLRSDGWLNQSVSLTWSKAAGVQWERRWWCFVAYTKGDYWLINAEPFDELLTDVFHTEGWRLYATKCERRKIHLQRKLL